MWCAIPKKYGTDRLYTSDANLYDKMKVREFLIYVASYYHVRNSDTRIRKLADLFDLDLGRKIPELSTGNKKKVAIIQAMVINRNYDP